MDGLLSSCLCRHRLRILPGKHVKDRVGEEAVAAVRHALNISYADALIMLGIVLLVFWIWFPGRSVRNRLTQATLTVSGYFRPRPDPAMEAVLRTAFSELDQELAAILGDRVAPTPPR